MHQPVGMRLIYSGQCHLDHYHQPHSRITASNQLFQSIWNYLAPSLLFEQAYQRRETREERAFATIRRLLD
jgi:hypothetical protein